MTISTRFGDCSGGTLRIGKARRNLYEKSKSKAALIFWLGERLRAMYRGDPFPVRSAAIEQDLKSSVDFSDVIAKYGFGVDGLELLPDFFQIQVKRGFKTT
jgi:hypothetical protein